LESFQNKPYCKPHRPTHGHTQVASIEMQTALKAPKAARMQKGVDQTARSTFAPGALKPVSGAEIVNQGGSNSSDIQSRHAPQRAYIAPETTPHVTYESRDSNLTGAADKFSKPTDQQSYGHDQTYDGYGDHGDQGYEDQGYDHGHQGYEDQGYDQGGYEDQGYDQGHQGYDQGGYEDQGYDQGHQGYEDQGYDQGGYDQGGYEDQGYEQGGYDHQGYEQGGYDHEGYDDQGYYEGEGYEDEYYQE